MTATAHSFIRIFQSLPLVEQNSVMVWIEKRKDFIENGVIDEAFSPMTSAEQQAFWQKMNVEHLFQDWSAEENDIWTNYLQEIN